MERFIMDRVTALLFHAIYMPGMLCFFSKTKRVSNQKDMLCFFSKTKKKF